MSVSQDLSGLDCVKLNLSILFYSHFLCEVVNVLKFYLAYVKLLLTWFKDLTKVILLNPMEITRVELVTSCLQGRRSPN